MRRLIWDVAGRTYHIVGNFMSWLVCELVYTDIWAYRACDEHKDHLILFPNIFPLPSSIQRKKEGKDQEAIQSASHLTEDTTKESDKTNEVCVFMERFYYLCFVFVFVLLSRLL